MIGNDNAARLDTELGEFEISESTGWRERTHLTAGEDENVYIQLMMPDRDDPEPAELRVDFYMQIEEHQVVAWIDVLKFAEVIIGNFNEAIRDEVEAAAEEERQREQREQEEREAAESKTKEREQMLLNELMGETVRVRHSGYRTTAKAVVEAREGHLGVDYAPGEDPTYLPWLRWDSANNANRRRSDVENWQLLDVKTDRGWRNVWDDGDSDIGGAVRSSRSKTKPWTGGLC